MLVCITYNAICNIKSTGSATQKDKKNILEESRRQWIVTFVCFDKRFVNVNCNYSWGLWFWSIPLNLRKKDSKPSIKYKENGNHWEAIDKVIIPE